MRLGQVFARLPSLNNLPSGAAGHAKPHLSLAISGVVSALELNARQWLMVAGVCLIFILTIMPLLYAIKALTEKMEKAEQELFAMDPGCPDSPKSGCSPRGRIRHKLGPDFKLAADARPNSPSSPEVRAGFQDDELNLAVAPRITEEAPAAGAPEARTATAPLGTRDAPAPEGTLEARSASGGSSQPWPPEDAWPGASPGVHRDSGASSPSSPVRSPEASTTIAEQQPEKLKRSHTSGKKRGAMFSSATSHMTRRLNDDDPKEADSSAGTDASSDGGDDDYTVNGGDIVDDMGISGMCLVCTRKQMRTVVLIAGQAFFLQALVLHHLAKSLQSQPFSQKSLPTIIVDAAIYLHFIVCVTDLPRSLFVARWFHQVHETWTETIVFGFIFIVDAFITPMAQLFIGALFLCTSVTVVDVIMNSCAVSYISTIDNMILTLRKSMNDLALDPDEFDDITFPVDPAIIKALNKALVVVPVLPVSFSLAMGFLGLKVFML